VTKKRRGGHNCLKKANEVKFKKKNGKALGRPWTKKLKIIGFGPLDQTGGPGPAPPTLRHCI